MKRKITLLALLSSTLLNAWIASARGEDEVDYNLASRFYAGAGLGIARLAPDVSGASTKDETGIGYSLHFGYDISERFSIEGAIADLGDVTLESDSTQQDIGSLDYFQYGISGLGYFYNSHGFSGSSSEESPYQLRSGISLYGRLGLSAMDISSSSSNLNIDGSPDIKLFGSGGLEYGWSSGYTARAELTSFSTDVQMLSLGFSKRFGGARSSISQTPHNTEQKAPPPTAKKPEPKASVSTPALSTDLDGDGINNNIDRCPDTPATATMVNSYGCHLDLAKLPAIKFQTGSAELTQKSQALLAWLARRLQDFPTTKLDVHAHTDGQGDTDANQRLSERRAEAVVNYLIAKGVSAKRLTADGFGESQPIADNSTSEGRQRNRRVEFHVAE